MRSRASESAPDNEDYRRIREMARMRALQAGLIPADAEDCAEVCINAMWQSLQAGQISLADFLTNDALLFRSADNCVKNFLRQNRRRQALHILETELSSEGGAFPDLPYPHLSPEREVLLQEFREAVRGILPHLAKSQRDTFARYFLKEESVTEIAQATGRTPHAVSQSILLLRRRLPALLEGVGLSLEEMREYLSLLTPPEEG